MQRRARRREGARDARTAGDAPGTMNVRDAAAALLARDACVAIAACTNGGGLSSVGGGGGRLSPSPLPSDCDRRRHSDRQDRRRERSGWGTVSGYTQSEDVASAGLYPPGAKITIKNLSQTTPHTLNVVGTATDRPALSAKSEPFVLSQRQRRARPEVLRAERSTPARSVTVTLSKPGIYLIGCAFHYIEFNMRDVIQVSRERDAGTHGVAGAAADMPSGERSAWSAARSLRSRPRGDAAARRSARARKFTLDIAARSPAGHNLRVGALHRRVPADQRAVCRRRSAGSQHGDLTRAAADDHARSRARFAGRRCASSRGASSANPTYWLLASGARSDVHAVMRALRRRSRRG